MTITEYLASKYFELPLKNNDGNFYYFIKNILESFIEGLNNVENNSVEEMLKPHKNDEHFKATYTKPRLINFLQKLHTKFLNILALCYKGDLYSAHKELDKLLNNQWSRYLIESYQNYLGFDIGRQGKIFYRMRDENKHDKNGNNIIIDNCFHVPFDKRQFAYTGRYNMLGYPCLYLGDSKETCDNELGELNKDTRWVGEFTPKQQLNLYDLRIPSEEIIKEANNYDLFRMVLAYPLIALCTTEAETKGYNEEYLFPQLLFQSLLIKRDAVGLIGILYSSTKKRGDYNIVIPALYSEKHPQQIGYSKIVLDLFDTNNPKIYKKK